MPPDFFMDISALEKVLALAIDLKFAYVAMILWLS